MATAVGEKDREMVDLKKRNDLLAKETERISAILKQSERKRRKQKVVYEKNMENLSIRLADFESNLRREQKEIQELISKKDQQIKVREELVKTLRQKLAQQHCSQCGYPNDHSALMELDWQLDIDDENHEMIKKLPPLDLPPPEETVNIGFTNHRPFRPKSKLSPVAEDSEVTFAALRNLHADLTPDRFHAALTASLNFLNDDEGVETPTNSTHGDENDTNNMDDSSISDVSASNVEIQESPVSIKVMKIESTESKKPKNGQVPDVLSSFCNQLSLHTLKLVNDNFSNFPSSDNKGACLQTNGISSRASPNLKTLDLFSMDIVQKSLGGAKSDLYHFLETKAKNERLNKRMEEKKPDNNNERLISAVVKVVDSFLSNDFAVKLLNEELKHNQHLLKNVAAAETPDSLSTPDVVSSNINNEGLVSMDNLTNGTSEHNDVRTNSEQSEPAIPTDNQTTEEGTSNVNGPINGFENSPITNGPTVVEKALTSDKDIEPSNSSITNGPAVVEEVPKSDKDIEPPNSPTTNGPAVVEDANKSEKGPENSGGTNSKKKKKKKKKKKRGSIQENDLVTTSSAPVKPSTDEAGIDATSLSKSDTSSSSVAMEGDEVTKEAGYQPVRSPDEDKYSLLLDEQLDALDELESSTPRNNADNKENGINDTEYGILDNDALGTDDAFTVSQVEITRM